MPIAALVLGIIGIAFALTPYLFWVGLPLAAVALVMAVVARRRGVPAATAGIARAALVLGILGVVLGAGAATTCAIVRSPDRFKEMLRGSRSTVETSTSTATASTDEDSDTDVDTEGVNDDGDDSDESDAPAQPPVAIGEAVTFDEDSIWTVTAARVIGKKLVDEGGDTMTTDGRFVEVRFRVKLLKSEPERLEGIGDLPSITDHDGDNGVEALEDTGRFLARGKKTAVGALLRPQQTQELTLIYEVPAELKDLRLELMGLDSTTTRLVELGL